MTILRATTTLADVPRGTDYDFNVIIEDEVGTVYNLTSCTVVLRLAENSTDAASVLQISGTIVDAPTGKVRFSFVPASTSGLMLRAYEVSVIVTSATAKIWVALQGKIGITPMNPAVTS